MRKLFQLLVFALTLLSVAPALAEPAERIFVRFEGSGADLEQFNNAIHRFQKEIFEAKQSQIEFVNRDDASNVYTQCHGLRVETDPMRERHCWFQVVERLGVEHFLEVKLVAQGDGRFEFKLDIWNPSTRGLIYTTFAEHQEPDLRAAFAKGLPRLAHDYLCFRGELDFCAPVLGPDGKPVGTTEGNNWLAWGLIGAGGLMLVAIIPVALVNRANNEELEVLPESHPDRQSYKDADTENTVAMQVLGALGTITFALGLSFLIFEVGLPADTTSSAQRTTILVAPTLGSDGMGLGLTVHF